MLLAHEVHGDDDEPTIVLLHGITESRESWRPLIPSLAMFRRVLAVDLRGHGESPSADRFDPVSYATDVVETVGALGLRRPLLVGHSLGGIVATAYAAMAPCDGVVNIDQPLRLSAFKESLAELEPLLRGTDAEFQQAMSRMFDSMAGPLPDRERRRLYSIRRPNRKVVMGTWGAVFESSAEELDALVEAMVSSVKVPYLSIHGLDPGEDYVEWLQTVLDNGTVAEWPDTGHYPHLLDPDRFLDRLEMFEDYLGR